MTVTNGSTKPTHKIYSAIGFLIIGDDWIETDKWYHARERTRTQTHRRAHFNTHLLVWAEDARAHHKTHMIIEMIKTHTLFDATNGNAQKNNALMWKINGCTENTNGKCTQINKNFDWIFFISYQRLRYYYFLLLLLSWIIQVFPVLSLDHSTLCDRSLFSFFSAIFVFFLIKFFFFGLLSDNFCTHKNDYLQRFLTNTKLIPFQTVQQPNLYAQTKTVKNIKKNSPNDSYKHRTNNAEKYQSVCNGFSQRDLWCANGFGWKRNWIIL